MSIKTELLKAIILLLVGAWLGVKFNPDNKPKVPEITQQQSAKCKAVVKKVTNPDGSKSEELSFESENQQSQSIKSKKDKKHSAIILKDQLSYSYKYIENDMLSLSPLIQLRQDKSVHGGIKIDF